MNIKLLGLTLFLILGAGCSSVPTQGEKETAFAKSIPQPADGKSGLYIYRYGSIGGVLKKDIWVNGKCIGESAPNVFFYQEVEGNKKHKVSTESEFSPNHLFFIADIGKNYFIKQYIKMGAFVGGADLQLVPYKLGSETIQELDLAKKGNCSSALD